MALFNCFSLVGRKKKDKGDQESSIRNKEFNTLLVKLEYPIQSPTAPYSIGNSKREGKVMSHDSPVTPIGYDGEDEQEENSPIQRDLSDFDLQARSANSGEEDVQSKGKKTNVSDLFDGQSENKTGNVAEKDSSISQTGYISDPGIGKAEFWASPKLKRSCSNLETRDVLKKIACQLPPSKSQSFEQLQDLARRMNDEVGNPGSPESVMTHRSADRVMLKKHSSSQILPSRSRRLWWKLFLWSHRNLHKPSIMVSQPIPVSSAFNRQGGYSSDTLELNRTREMGKMESPGSFTGQSRNDDSDHNQIDNQSWNGFQIAVSGLWPQNQWVAFSTESSSPFNRVDEWVKDLEIQSPLPIESEGSNDQEIVFPHSPETGRSPERSTFQLTNKHSNVNLSEEILHANSVIQSLNSSSTVAHISGIGLKVLPTISQFSSLRSVNLSNNSLVHITPGCLPKCLHTLNLSRNKINNIEGLRELTRLRVLDLSYNRISRMGHGLSNCTLIKELYLAGNKISDVEGLHRLLKLTVLDLSFNKITTTKGLGQLVANYNSLLALNILGNPIQSNISDEQLRKAVCGLLTKLAYLNKQPIKPQRAREAVMDNVARAALGNSSRSSKRRAVKRVGSQGGSGSSAVHRSSSTNAGHKSRHRSTNRTHHHSPSKLKSSSLPSTSH